MAKLVGTAGHVDHGKTSLIRALTGIDADRLPEEKKRGLTIDLGFAFLDLPEVGRVSIVDVPGHEKFVTNMLAGATGMDVVLLCIAADHGVQAQTSEHLEILSMLPVETMIVALTRSDLVDSHHLEEAVLEVEILLEETHFAGAKVVATSAESGMGIEELKGALVEALLQESPERPKGWFLPVDRVFSQPGHGTVVTGTLSRGEIAVGSEAEVLPSGKAVRVRGVHSHGDELKMVDRGRRVALNLSGIDREDLERGDLIAQRGVGTSTECFDAEVNWVKGVKHSSRVRVAMGSTEAIGRVFLNDHDEKLVQFRLEKPVGIVQGMPIVVRQYSPPRVLGGGRVTVPVAEPRRKNAKLVSKAAHSVLDAFEGVEDGLETAKVARRLGVEERSLAKEFEKLKSTGELLGFAGMWMTPPLWEEVSGRLKSALEKMHEASPEKRLLNRDIVFREAGIKWRGKVADRMISRWALDELIRVGGIEIALVDHRPTLKPKQRKMLDQVVGFMNKNAPNIPSNREIADKANVPHQAIDQIVQTGIEAGELVRVGDGLFFPVEVLENMQRALVEEFGEGTFSAGEFRDKVGTSRKYAIPLLEYFDSKGVTVRVGDVRKVTALGSRA